MKTRICLAPGQWQIVMLASALRQEAIDSDDSQPHEDYLILYVNYAKAGLTADRKATMLQIANAVWQWKKIIWLNDFFDPESDNGRYTITLFKRILVELKAKIGVKQCDEIWTCQLRGISERIVAEAYQDVPIVLYEDGVGTYTNQWYVPPLSLYPLEGIKLIKNYCEHLIPAGRVYNKFRLSSRHLSRLSGIYFYLASQLQFGTLLSKIPQITIQNQQLKDTINTCSLLANIPENFLQQIQKCDRPVLILGQCFSLGGSLEWEQELAIYAQIVKTLLQQKYQVIWKEHPRVADKPFFSPLSQKYSSSNLIDVGFPFTLPIELVAAKLGLSACIAASSTALFYLPQLYEMEAYTFADRFLPYIKNSDRQGLDLVLDKIKSIDDLSDCLSAKN